MTETEDRSEDRPRAKRAPAKRSTAKRSAPRRPPEKRTAEKRDSEKPAPEKPAPEERSAPRAESRRRPGATRIAAEAARQLVQLTGKEPEGIIGLERTEDGWTVEVEVLELRRVPSTTDVLATYAVTVDEDGELEGYQRRARYVRGAAAND